MRQEANKRLMEEAELANRFSELYRRQFAQLIDGLNGNVNQPSDRVSLRLCIEAVDMMLVTQSHLTRAIAQLDVAAEPRRATVATNSPAPSGLG